MRVMTPFVSFRLYQDITTFSPCSFFLLFLPSSLWRTTVHDGILCVLAPTNSSTSTRHELTQPGLQVVCLRHVHPPGCGRWYVLLPRHLRTLLREGGGSSCGRLRCYSCHVFVVWCCSRASVLETLLTALTRLVLPTATYRRQKTEEKHADRHENIDAMKWRLEHCCSSAQNTHEKWLQRPRRQPHFLSCVCVCEMFLFLQVVCGGTNVRLGIFCVLAPTKSSASTIHEKSYTYTYTNIHTHTHIYICIYIYICVCVCVCMYPS